MNRHLLPAALACAVLLPATPSSAQLPPTATTDAQAEEIVVTAQRTGVPVWRVAGPRGTVVLVGGVGYVPAGTRWDPAPLDAALAKADRVMFPESLGFGNIGLFSAIGAFGKWRSQASLPKGRTLQAITTPEQWARLVALQRRGLLKPGFERKHPYHLALALGRVRGSKRKSDPGAESYARRYVKKNKAKRVPLARIDFKALMRQYFAIPARAHVPCMMGAVGAAEAGAAGVEARWKAHAARSAAWAARRVPEALAATVDNWAGSCWPLGTSIEAKWEASHSSTVRGLLNRPQVTVAVMSLNSLGKPGGVLDDLVAAGFEVRGPRWKR